MRLQRIPVDVFVLAAVLVGMATGTLLSVFSTRGSHDDAWRRTASGWERVSGWQAQASNSMPARTARIDAGVPSARFDTHPAALALLQIGVVVGALAFYSRPPVEAQNQQASVPAIISRSYRASFFGS
jgi:hypothetical protein